MSHWSRVSPLSICILHSFIVISIPFVFHKCCLCDNLCNVSKRTHITLDFTNFTLTYKRKNTGCNTHCRRCPDSYPGIGFIYFVYNCYNVDNYEDHCKDNLANTQSCSCIRVVSGHVTSRILILNYDHRLTLGLLFHLIQLILFYYQRWLLVLSWRLFRLFFRWVIRHLAVHLDLLM